MQFARAKDKYKVRASVEMTPIIDVVFLLLIFFMLSSTFVQQTSIPIEEPVARGAGKMENRDITVTLTVGTCGPEDGGEVFVNDLSIATWGELTEVLGALHRENPDALVLIRPDARVTTARLVQVLGIANSIGIQRYGIAARPPETEE